MAWNEVANLRGPGMEYRGNYSSGTNYTPGDVVYYSYSTWVAKVPTRGVAPSTSGTGAANWGQVAARGATGAQGATGPVGAPGPAGPAGQGLKFRGLWDSSTLYVANDVVNYSGASWIATGSSANVYPQLLSRNWALLSGTPNVHGSLRWSGPWYNPYGNTFTRLKATSDGRLVTYKDTGGCTATDGDNPRLIAPVSGWYQLSATQVWGNGPAVKGAGLGTSLTDGMAGMYVWDDFNGKQFGTVSRSVYMDAGTAVYPWTFNGPNSGLSPGDRGMQSEYSIVLLQQA